MMFKVDKKGQLCQKNGRQNMAFIQNLKKKATSRDSMPHVHVHVSHGISSSRRG